MQHALGVVFFFPQVVSHWFFLACHLVENKNPENHIWITERRSKNYFKKPQKNEIHGDALCFFVEFCFGACQLCVNETFKNTGKAILEHSFEPPLIFTDLVSKERKHELYIGKMYSISQRGSQSYSKWFDDLNESTVHRIQEWMHFHSTIHFYFQHCSITKFYSFLHFHQGSRYFWQQE